MESIIFEKIKQRKGGSPDEEVKALQSDLSLATFTLYVEKFGLSVQGQLAMLERADRMKFFEAFLIWSRIDCLCQEAQLKLCDYPQWQELLELYMGRGPFGEDLQVKLMKMPQAGKLLEKYAGIYWFCSEAEVLMLERDDAVVLECAYLKKNKLGRAAQVKMLESEKAVALVSEYVKVRTFDGDILRVLTDEFSSLWHKFSFGTKLRLKFMKFFSC